MKNNFKRDYLGKNSKNSHKNYKPKNHTNSRDVFIDKNTSRRNRDLNLNNFETKKEFNNLRMNDRNEKNYFSSRKRNALKKPNSKFSNIFEKKEEQSLNKKSFDDWIWGKHSVYNALTSDRSINRIWCTSEIFSSDKFYILLKEHKAKGVLIEEVSWQRLSQLTSGAVHQGVAMQLAFSKTISLNELITVSKENATNPVILALDGITDPHNLGAIIRSAEAFNCKGIVIPQRRSAGLTGTVAKVAAGALEHIPVSRVVNLNRSLDELKRNGFITIGMTGDAQIPITEFTDRAPLVLIVGSEDKGISLLTQKKCDYLLNIPLKGKTSSLNASVAAAISLFHITKN